MTFREAYATVQGLTANFTPEVKDTTVYRLLKAATIRFASETAATIRTHEITPDGSRDYALPQVRLGRIWRVEHEVSSVVYPVRGITPEELDLIDRATNTTGSPIANYTRFGRTLRVWPLASSGSLRIYHAPIPVLANRDSANEAGETATAGSVTTASATTITHGLVANRAGTTDYFNGCRIAFTSGTLDTQSSFITSTNEGASAVTFTFSPAVSTAVTTHTFRIEDVLEVPDEFTMACVNYAAGIIAGMDSKAKQMAQFLLGDFEAMFLVAKRRGFALGPGTQQRMISQEELAYSNWPMGWR